MLNGQRRHSGRAQFDLPSEMTPHDVGRLPTAERITCRFTGFLCLQVLSLSPTSLFRQLYISAKLRGGENKWSDCQFSKACLEAWVVQAGVNLTIESRTYQFRRR
jgi:hypothetical protein